MFDPYHRWLAIPPDQRPPTYYQLLGVSPDEADPEVIQEAALRQTSHVRLYQTGPHAGPCAALLNEIGQARAVLLNPEKRKQYDARLARPAEQAPPPAPPPLPAPAPAAEWPPGFPARPRRARAPEQGSVLPPALAFAGVLLVGAGLAFAVGRSAPPERPDPPPQPPVPRRPAAPVVRPPKPTPALEGHEAEVRALAVTADGSVLSAGGDYAAGAEGDATGCAPRRWDLRTGHVLLRYAGPPTPVLCLGVSPDGQQFATGAGGYGWGKGGAAGRDCLVRVHDLKTADPVRTLEGHAAPVRGVAFLPGGKGLLSVGSDGVLLSWAAGADKPQELARDLGPAGCLAAAPTGDLVLVGCTNGLWTLSRKEGGVRRFKRLRSPVHAAAFSPDGKQAVTAGGRVEYRNGKSVLVGCVVRVFDAASGEMKQQLVGHQAPVLAVAWSARAIASGSLDGTVRLWAPGKDQAVRTLQAGGPVTCVAFAPGNRLLAGTRAGPIRVFDLGRDALPFPTKEKP
jgi:hypothetical protein